MRREIIIGDTVIISCARCPRNLEYANPLLRFLPPTHYCGDTVDIHTKGHLILNPNTIPTWCPHAKSN